ncbi:MAG: TIGR03905 family TSCPD domain-containing protein [Erysipelotrichaceae bacterium]|nr:TIGR03905 family TSCPD domain-containing protein [Erysipelotrichaceae bacterium]
MEQKLVYTPQNVCARSIEITHEDGVIKNITFTRGCSGNTQGVARLCVGRKIEEVIALLEGIKCPGSRTQKTSCPDQLAQALKTIQ